MECSSWISRSPSFSPKLLMIFVHKNRNWVFDGGTNALPLRKIQKQSRTVSRDFYPWGVANSNWLDQKISEWLFFLDISLKTFALKKFCCSLFSVVPEHTHVDPKNIIVSGMGWTRVVGSTWDFSEADHNRDKFRIFGAASSIGSAKTHHVQLFGRTARPKWSPPPPPRAAPRAELPVRMKEPRTCGRVGPRGHGPPGF